MRNTIALLLVALVSAGALAQTTAVKPQMPNDVCMPMCGTMCMTQNEFNDEPLPCNAKASEIDCYKRLGECKEVKGKCEWTSTPELRVCLMAAKRR